MEDKTQEDKVRKKKVRKVIVIKNNLKYRIPGFKKGESFIPKIGDTIPIPVKILKKEIETGNVRLLLKEEREQVKKKLILRKKK